MIRTVLKNIKIACLIILFVAAIIYQGRRAWLFLSDYIQPALSISSSNAIERSTALAFHGNFAQFIHFLRNTIPENAKVIFTYPYPNGIGEFGYHGLDQYFLFPRDIKICSSIDTCNLQGNEYIIYQNGFPSPSELPSLHLELHTESLGVYVP